MWLAFLAFVKPIGAFLKAVPWWVYLVAGALLAAFLYGEARYNAGQADVQGRWDKANTKAEEENRAKEEGWRKGITDWATQETNKRLTGEREFAQIVDGLQSGAGDVRVRPRLKCPVPKAPGTASGNDGSSSSPGESAGFQESDAVVVLRIAEDADSVASRLAQCQNYVRTVSGSSGGSR